MLRRLLIISNTLMISLSCLCAYCKGLHPLRGRSYAGVLFPVLTCGATRSHPHHRATIKALPSPHHPPSPLRIHSPARTETASCNRSYQALSRKLSGISQPGGNAVNRQKDSIGDASTFTLLLAGRLL